MFDIALVCARCQPPTRAHFAAVARARSLAHRVVMLVLNADDASSPEHPFSNIERSDMLTAVLGTATPTIVMLRDRRYEPARWRATAAAALETVVGHGSVIVLADAEPATTSLPLPAHWRRVDGELQLAAAEGVARHALLDAAQPDWARLAAILPPPLLPMLEHWTRGAQYQALAAEAAFVRDYRAVWQVAPYAPVFVTVDSVATWRNQVLLIERGQMPGRGQWALPGGFIDVDETIEQSCLRELREETGVELDRTAISAVRVFDDPLRSQRGRIITHACRFVLDALPAPPLAVGTDDAAAAMWLPIDELQPERLYDDHYFILQSFLGLD